MLICSSMYILVLVVTYPTRYCRYRYILGTKREALDTELRLSFTIHRTTFNTTIGQTLRHFIQDSRLPPQNPIDCAKLLAYSVAGGLIVSILPGVALSRAINVSDPGQSNEQAPRLEHTTSPPYSIAHVTPPCRLANASGTLLGQLVIWATRSGSSRGTGPGIIVYQPMVPPSICLSSATEWDFGGAAWIPAPRSTSGVVRPC